MDLVRIGIRLFNCDDKKWCIFHLSNVYIIIHVFPRKRNDMFCVPYKSGNVSIKRNYFQQLGIHSTDNGMLSLPVVRCVFLIFCSLSVNDLVIYQ